MVDGNDVEMAYKLQQNNMYFAINIGVCPYNLTNRLQRPCLDLGEPEPMAASDWKHSRDNYQSKCG